MAARGRGILGLPPEGAVAGAPQDPAAGPVGISGVTSVMLAADGGAYADRVVRQLSELYLIEGLR
jgi:hypothetical protein